MGLFTSTRWLDSTPTQAATAVDAVSTAASGFPQSKKYQSKLIWFALSFNKSLILQLKENVETDLKCTLEHCLHCTLYTLHTNITGAPHLEQLTKTICPIYKPQLILKSPNSSHVTWRSFFSVRNLGFYKFLKGLGF